MRELFDHIWTTACTFKVG